MSRRRMGKSRAPGRRAAAERRGPRFPGLHDLHLRLDRPAEGGDEHPPGDRQPPALDAGDLRPDGRGPDLAENAVQLRRLGLGALLAAHVRCPTGLCETGGAQGQRLPGGSDRGRKDHDAALRAVDAGGFSRGGRRRTLYQPGSCHLLGRGAALRASAPFPRASRGPAAKPLRSDRSGGRRDLPPVRAAAAAFAGADRPSGRQHGDPHPRPPPGAGSGGDPRRAPDRRRAADAGLPPLLDAVTPEGRLLTTLKETLPV